jgi:hypothetical protein
LFEIKKEQTTWRLQPICAGYEIPAFDTESIVVAGLVFLGSTFAITKAFAISTAPQPTPEAEAASATD